MDWTGLGGKLDAIHSVLSEIRDALVPPPDEPIDGCQHPDERRIDLSTMADRHHIVCGVCKERIS